jgi:hypothetical protein
MVGGLLFWRTKDSPHFWNYIVKLRGPFDSAVHTTAPDSSNMHQVDDLCTLWALRFAPSIYCTIIAENRSQKRAKLLALSHGTPMQQALHGRDSS